MLNSLEIKNVHLKLFKNCSCLLIEPVFRTSALAQAPSHEVEQIRYTTDTNPV